jgi:aromatic ring-opening dioxygenase catalytic subunit (LigB family)
MNLSFVTVVTDYGDENPLYYDYYGFPPDLYQLKFRSRGDSAVSRRVVDVFEAVCHRLPLHLTC